MFLLLLFFSLGEKCVKVDSESYIDLYVVFYRNHHDMSGLIHINSAVVWGEIVVGDNYSLTTTFSLNTLNVT